MTTDNKAEVINIVEAAEILGVSQGTILNWHRKGWHLGYRQGVRAIW